MLVTVSCQCCPTGLVQGQNKRTEESLLCGEVHYQPGCDQAPRWQLCYKVRFLASAAQDWVFCYELLRISECLWCWARSETKSRKTFRCRFLCDRLVVLVSLILWHWYSRLTLLGASFLHFDFRVNCRIIIMSLSVSLFTPPQLYVAFWNWIIICEACLNTWARDWWSDILEQCMLFIFGLFTTLYNIYSVPFFPNVGKCAERV